VAKGTTGKGKEGGGRMRKGERGRIQRHKHRVQAVKRTIVETEYQTFHIASQLIVVLISCSWLTLISSSCPCEDRIPWQMRLPTTTVPLSHVVLGESPWCKVHNQWTQILGDAIG